MMNAVKLNIERQGKPVVDDAFLLCRHDDVAVILIDMKTKRGTVDCYTSMSPPVEGPGIQVSVIDESLEYDETQDGWTHIQFPEYKGWDVLTANYSKYTVSVCLINYEEIDNHE